MNKTTCFRQNSRPGSGTTSYASLRGYGATVEVGGIIGTG